jgi:hypothetical protein
MLRMTSMSSMPSPHSASSTFHAPTGASKQLAGTVLMVEPVRFGYNPQAAESNSFMQSDDALTNAERAHLNAQALEEFRGLHEALSCVGLKVIAVQDTPEPHTPDSIFPNNWLSTHEDGTIVLYPMEPQNRRLERRADIVSNLIDRCDYVRVLDLSPYERLGIYLEGTGSLVLDRVHGIAYANRSSRMNPRALEDFCQRTGYTSVMFTAQRADGTSIYHTNVLMAVGADTAVICSEAIADAAERASVLASLRQHHGVVVEISFAQMDDFAGNMLQLAAPIPSHEYAQTDAGSTNTEPPLRRFWVMSSRAYHALTSEQQSLLQHDGSVLIHAPLAVIEQYGGGSARCMIAEVFVPPVIQAEPAFRY